MSITKGILSLALGVTCSCAPIWAAAIDTLTKVRDTQTLTMAFRETPPFSFTDENKSVTGYAVDICLKMAEAIKHQLKLPKLTIIYLPVDTTTRFSTIIDGRADLECGSTTNNAERRAKVGFVLPHFFSSVRMIVHADKGIKNWADLQNQTVAITKSTTTLSLIDARNNIRSLNIKVIEGQDDAESFRLMEQGKATAYAMDDILLYSFRATSKTPNAFAIVGDPLSVEPYSIMLHKDDPNLKKILDDEMLRIINSGEIFTLYKKWFLSPINSKGINMNMPMSYLLRDFFRYPTNNF